MSVELKKSPADQSRAERQARAARAPRSFAELRAAAAAADAELRLHQQEARTLAASLYARAQYSAGWLLPAAGLATGWLAARGRTVLVLLGALRYVRFARGPASVVLRWIRRNPTARAVVG